MNGSWIGRTVYIIPMRDSNQDYDDAVITDISETGITFRWRDEVNFMPYSAIALVCFPDVDDAEGEATP